MSKKGESFNIYPAIFTPAEEGGFLVDFPDFDGNCFTEGDSLGEAFEMAADVLAGTIINILSEEKEIPVASNINDFTCENGSFVNYVEVDVIKYRNNELKKAVRSNVSLPKWLDEIAKAKNISYSGMLQHALLQEFDLEFLYGKKMDGIEEVLEVLQERKITKV